MKRSYFVMFLFALGLGSCMSTHAPIIFDETLPDTETATIYWAGGENYVRPVSYNGVAVDWKTESHGYHPIIIPAGKTTFELRGYVSYTIRTASHNTSLGNSFESRWNYTGKSISYDFAKGESYTIVFYRDIITIHAGKSYAEKTFLESFEFDDFSFF